MQDVVGLLASLVVICIVGVVLWGFTSVTLWYFTRSNAAVDGSPFHPFGDRVAAPDESDAGPDTRSHQRVEALLIQVWPFALAVALMVVVAMLGALAG